MSTQRVHEAVIAQKNETTPPPPPVRAPGLPAVSTNNDDTPDTTDVIAEAGQDEKNHTGARKTIRAIDLVRSHLERCDTLHSEIVEAEATPTDKLGLGRLISSLSGRSDTIGLKREQVDYALHTYLVNVKANQFVRDNERGFSIGVLSTKGGVGKTTVSAVVAVNIAAAGQMSVIMIETNENDGTLKSKLGLVRAGSYLLPEVARDPRLINSHTKIAAHLGKHSQVPVYCLLSDPNNDNYEGLNLSHMLALANEAERHAAVTVYDTGNGLGANEAAFLKADVVLVPILADDETSCGTALTTLINLWMKGHATKIRNNVRLVITGVKNNESAEMFMGGINDAAISAADESGNPDWVNNHMRMLEDFGICSEKVDLISYSAWLKQDRAVSVLPEEIGPQTTNDTLRLINNCLSMGIQTDEEKQTEINRRIDESTANSPSDEPDKRHDANKSILDGFADQISDLSSKDLDFLLRELAKVAVNKEESSQTKSPQISD